MISAIVLACYLGMVECRPSRASCVVDSMSNVCLNETTR